MHINDLIDRAHSTAISKGWWSGDDHNVPEKLALIHAEVSDCLEEYRNGHELGEVYYEGSKPCGFITELSDIVIRIADLCGQYDLDLDGAIEEKLNFNVSRPFRHGNKVC
jgi:NTP pyrophosphatase (non-canonical NTP hydrolase)